jgi:putative two-component system response regulator
MIDSSLDKLLSVSRPRRTEDNKSIKTLHEMAVEGEALTLNHGKAVSEIANLMCLELDTTIAYTKALTIAAYFHDIGKNRIPISIIHKTGILSYQERELIKEHAMLGYFSAKDSLLAYPGSFTIHESNLIEVVALTHHEYWDGSGYPLGLKQLEIPLSSRICTYGDIFDAMTATRSYKDRAPIKDAVSFIHDNLGIIFDPALYDVFTKVIALKYDGLIYTPNCSC